MTREEALNVIWLRCQHNDKTYEAYCVLKHEQQPCDDATLKDIFCMGCEYKEQQPKTGHWIDITNKHGTVIAAKCSCCKNYPKHAIKSIFCPNCGAKMVEGGDKE